MAALLLLVVVGPVVQEYSAQAASRYPLTAAIVEDQTVSLDGYEDVVLIDQLVVDGELYSDKAPGQPILAIPAYVAGQLVGAEPATVLRADGNLGVWGVTFWTSVLPAVALLVLMGFAVRDHPGPAAVLGPLSLSVGTLLLPFAAQMYTHVLTALLGFGAWLLVRDGTGPLSSWRAAAAGALCGLAVTVEYPAGIFVVVVAVLIATRSARRLVAFALAGLPFALALLAYQDRVLGSPFESSYSGKDVHEGAGALVTGLPKLGHALQILFGSRGILLFTPIVGAALVGLVIGRRTQVLARRDVRTCAAVLLAFFLLQAGWVNPWGGEMPGPRYLIPALPFLVLGAVVAWTRWPRTSLALTCISTITMTFPLVLRHFVDHDEWLIGAQLGDLDHPGVMPSLFTLAVGRSGWLVHLALIALVLRWLLLELRTLPSTTPAVAAPAPA